jgi:hypothetical protein
VGTLKNGLRDSFFSLSPGLSPASGREEAIVRAPLRKWQEGRQVPRAWGKRKNKWGKGKNKFPLFPLVQKNSQRRKSIPPLSLAESDQRKK